MIEDALDIIDDLTDLHPAYAIALALAALIGYHTTWWVVLPLLVIILTNELAP